MYWLHVTAGLLPYYVMAWCWTSGRPMNIPDVATIITCLIVSTLLFAHSCHVCSIRSVRDFSDKWLNRLIKFAHLITIYITHLMMCDS
jgi:hypothetical protein